MNTVIFEVTLQLRPVHMFGIIIVVGILGFLLSHLSAKDKPDVVVKAYSEFFCDAGSYLEKKYRMDRRKFKGRRFKLKTQKIHERWWTNHPALIPVYHYSVKQMAAHNVTGRDQRIINKKGIKNIYKTANRVHRRFEHTCKNKKISKEAVVDISVALLVAAYIPPPAVTH